MCRLARLCQHQNGDGRAGIWKGEWEVTEVKAGTSNVGAGGSRVQPNAVEGMAWPQLR